MHSLAAFLLALALSADSLTVGLTYGARGIRLSGGALLVVSAVSGLVLGLAALVGRGVALTVGAQWVRQAGALVLLGIGLLACWHAVRQAWRAPRGALPQSPQAEAGPQTLFTWRLPALRLAVAILREPAAADVDGSGAISPAEAVALGFALAADSFGAGLGAGMAGLHLLPLALLTAAAGGVALFAGARLAARVSGRLAGPWGVVPGLVLIALGVTRLMALW